MNCMVFDGHCDTAVELWRKGEPLYENNLAVSLKRAKRLNGYAQFFAFCTAWIDDGLPHTEQYRRALTAFEAQLLQNQDSAALCRSLRDAEAALQAGKTAVFLALEGAEAIGCDPGRLDEAYTQGVRMVSLVWNIENELTGSCKTGTGLSEKGKAFFRRAQALGMLVDVSHLSERGFWDMVELAEKPIVASHSNSRTVCDHVRNLTDAQFQAIVRLGGTVGLNLVGSFLSEDGTASFDAFRRHFDHFLALGGEGHIGLGLDLDGSDELPPGFTGVEHYEALAEYLTRCGYSEQTLQNLFCDSWMEVVRSCII